MNLPQICSVLVIFSLVILLGFGSVGIAEAAKAPGVYQTETNSKAVCGDRLCDTPMSIEEKIAEFRDESEELVNPGSFGARVAKSGVSLMTGFAEGLANVVGGPIGGVLFATLFPTNDGGADYTAAIADMEVSLQNSIDAQTTVLLGALTEMEYSLIESISDQSDNQFLIVARALLDDWRKSHNQYLNDVISMPLVEDSDLNKLLALRDKWPENFDYLVMGVLTDPLPESQNLRIQGFPSYWMGQLMTIAFLQDQAQLDYSVDPNVTGSALNIKPVVVEMSEDLEIVVGDAKEVRKDQMTWTCVDYVKTSETKYDIPLRVVDNYGISNYGSLDSYTVKNLDSVSCTIKDAIMGIDLETQDTSTYWRLEAKCAERGIAPGNDWEMAIPPVNGLCDYYPYVGVLVKPGYTTGLYGPMTLYEIEERFEEYREIWMVDLNFNSEVEENYAPYYAALAFVETLTCEGCDAVPFVWPTSVDTTSVDTTSVETETATETEIIITEEIETITETATEPEIIITAEIDEEVTSGSGETTQKFCGQMSISELINSGNYNVVDNRQASSAQVVDGTDEKDLYLASSHGDTFRGKGGNDCIIGGEGNDDLQGWGGDDKVYGRGGDDTVAGGPGNDVLGGGPGNDTLLGRAGNDNMWGGDGNDTLEGEDGNDNLRGGDGNDVLKGGPGNDNLKGQRGDDKLFGGNGDDTLRGGPGNDLLQGGPGIDKLFGSNEINTCTDPDDKTVIQGC